MKAAALPAADVTIIHRTVVRLVAAPGGRRRRTQSTETILHRKSRAQSRPGATPPAGRDVASPDTRMGTPPLPALYREAGRGIAGVAWFHAFRAANGDSIETRGVGSAPPSEVRLFRRDQLALTVTQQWVADETGYRLESQETVTPDATFRELIKVTHPARPASDRWSRTGAMLGGVTAGSPSFSRVADECLVNDFDPCSIERMANVNAAAAALAAGAAAAIACVAPTPDLLPGEKFVLTVEGTNPDEEGPGACLLALVMYGLALDRSYIARANLTRCEEEAARKSGCDCPTGSFARVPIEWGSPKPSASLTCDAGGWSDDGGAGGETCGWWTYWVSRDGGRTWVDVAIQWECEPALG